VAPAPDGFIAGRFAPIPGGREIRVSAGAFEAGNTILGIGVRATASDGSIAGFSPTIRFDLDNDSYQPASFEKDSDGRTIRLNNDGGTSFSTYAEPGDFTVQFEGSASWRGSSINVREAATGQLPAATVQLPGGVGSGTSYDFAFRAFAQPAAKSYQMFIDMTAIPKLYGSTDPASVYSLFFSNKAGVGPIGDRVTVSLNGLGTNNVVFGADLTLPPVDLDVDSDNADTIPDPASDPVDRSSAEEAIEDEPALPGVIVPVGGDRAKMIVHVPQGRKATLAITQGADKVRLWTAQTGGTAIPAAGTTIVGGGSPQTYWIEAFAPSASMADIAFTLTASGTGTASSDKIRATAAGMNMVAHRTGGRLGEVVSEDLESAGDPNSYMILTNRDFEQGLPLAGRDFDDEIALLPPLLGPEGQFDDDLAKLTLKKLPSDLNAGSVRLKVSHPAAVRLFKADAATGLGVPLLAGEWSASLGGSGYLAQLKSRDVDIWLEGLSMVKDFVFTVEYVAPSGSVLSSDDVHMLIADWTFRGSDGYEVPFVSPVWLDALLAATDSPKKPLADPTGAFYKIHIDGLAPQLVTQLRVASDSTADFYTESYAGGDFDTAYSTATVSRRFGVLHSAAHVLYAPEDPVVTPAQRQLIRETLDLNVVHNDGLRATVLTPWDVQSDQLKKHGRFEWSLTGKPEEFYKVGDTILGTVAWPEKMFPVVYDPFLMTPISPVLYVQTYEDAQQSTRPIFAHQARSATFQFKAQEEGYLRLTFSAAAPNGMRQPQILSSILVRITANGKLPKWEAQAWNALKVDRFVPGDPINRNRQINTRYAEMYNEGISQDRPNPYGWFGVAAFVSTGVGVGMSTTMSWDAAPDSVGVDSRKVVEGLADGNLTIFIDVYKQALAYRDGGLKELEDMLKAGELSDERQLRAWTKIHAGMGKPADKIPPDQALVDEGVRLLVQVEQDTTLQRVLNKDLALWQTVTDNWGTWLQANVTSPHWKSFLMTAPIPGDYSTFQQFRYEDPGVPDKVSFADVNARLAWFDKKLFPAWKVWRAANPGTINIPKLLAGDYQK
jgi:hypothetical protein